MITIWVLRINEFENEEDKLFFKLIFAKLIKLQKL